ncbi:hypothetical protein KIN20_010615 [Parelaphostrongylus tenuis]|uniref:Nucleotide-diphospho-sugar transferase domain-containing protein n=1 Tax=Parelaphostrongylus tenuis TaxID=148309 RepID=A0AAD5MCS8_PARTN|nr:hypothetical protein KIN20_010615 [Parelaphostrongylus tenuis]
MREAWEERAKNIRTNKDCRYDDFHNDDFQFAIYENSMSEWICGATFFVRASPITVDFFEKVALLMTRRQSSRSSTLTYLCGAQHYKCAKMPHWLASSSNFFKGNRDVIPIIVQIDQVSKLSKMELFKRENFVFINNDSTCNASAVLRLKETVAIALNAGRKETVGGAEVSTLDHLLWCLNRWLGFSPHYYKRFLRVHESIM